MRSIGWKIGFDAVEFSNHENIGFWLGSLLGNAGLSDAGSHQRRTKMLYPNHRPSPWLNEDATRDRSNRLLDVIRRDCLQTYLMPCPWHARQFVYDVATVIEAHRCNGGLLSCEG